MVRTGLTIDRMFAAALVLSVMTPLARAGDSVEGSPTNRAPLELPRVTNLLLDEQARRARRKSDNVEKADFLMLTPGLRPVTWPRNDDLRARLLTTQVKSTPVVGWLAENLYRSRSDNGWCLEVDPGDSKYAVFYRFHPRK
jgi:hypothetical protein